MYRLLIGIDIGNSSIGIGYFARGLLLTQRLETYPLRDEREYALDIEGFISQNHIEKKDLSCIICSVVPGHTAVLARAFERVAGRKVDVLNVQSGLDTGLCLEIDAPDRLGADRLACAAGAYDIYRRPVAVVDFGTATTVTVVDSRACLLGGAIMPGLALMNSVLGRMTSQLKEVLLEPPRAALGKDTSAGIRSGLFYGTAGAVERIIAGIEQETGVLFFTVITGGQSQVMQPFLTRPCERMPDLIFEGLRIIYEKNRP